MYLTFKVHKEELSSRAIISACGSVTEPIGSYCNILLQKIIKHLDYSCRNSKEFYDKITSRKWPNCKLVTIDAESMYTNIHWPHARDVIEKFLYSAKGKQICKQSGVDAIVLITFLNITMTENYFIFGDTYWHQISGTAMGTPPAPPYSTLFFAIHEMNIMTKYENYLELYTRYIDDCCLLWNTSIANSMSIFESFNTDMNSYGCDHNYLIDKKLKPLKWVFKPMSNKAVFLDLNIRLSHDDGTITTSLYEKPMNLHLYLPPHSCHSQGILKGLIHGEVYRAYLLCTNIEDCYRHINNTYHRLIQRGHNSILLRNLFYEAIVDKCDPARHTLQHQSLKEEGLTINLLVRYNPADPPLSKLHRNFEENFRDLPTIPVDDTNKKFCNLKKLRPITCKQKSLGNILSPSTIRFPPTISVEEELHWLQMKDKYHDDSDVCIDSIRFASTLHL